MAKDPCGVDRADVVSRWGDSDIRDRAGFPVGVGRGEFKDYRHGRVAQDYHSHVN